jgi:hypothetical protein
MPYFKAPDNSLHFIDSDEFAPLLPEGSVQITDEEANPPKTRQQELTEQIAAIDVQLRELDLSVLRTRGARELDIKAVPLLAMIESTLTVEQKAMLVQIKAQLYEHSPAYQRIVDAEMETAAGLRAQRKVLDDELEQLEGQS